MSEMLIEGEDCYINADGKFVFTEKYHLRRGSCCESGCLHCPYGFKRTEEESAANENQSLNIKKRPGTY